MEVYMEKEAFLNYLNKEFVNKFVKAIMDYNMYYRKIGIEIMRALPKPFRNINRLTVNTKYIKNMDCLTIQFVTTNRTSINYQVIENAPFFEGLIDFEREKDEIEGIFYQAFSIDELLSQDMGGFIIYLSPEAFIKRAKNPKEFANEIIRSNVDYYNEYAQFHLKEKNKDYDKNIYISELKKIADEFYTLIHDENTPELVIDKFLEDNPIILKEGLKIDKLIHQSKLKNILSKYAHDLKPDLIGFDTSEKKWVIVDYKKANKDLIKNVDKTRTGLKSEVHSLKNQLYDYVEYFDEAEQRKEFKNKYRVNIEHPSAIGIIGKLDDHLNDAFNRLLKLEPRWLKILPYNYLYDNFINFIKTGEKFIH
jgi:hypothetical protein